MAQEPRSDKDVPPHHARVHRLEEQLLLAQKQYADAAAAYEAYAQKHGNIAGLTSTLPPGVRENAGTLNLNTTHAGSYPEVVGANNDLAVKVQLRQLQEADHAALAAVARLQRDLETAVEFQMAMDDFILIMARVLLGRDPGSAHALDSFFTAEELAKLRSEAAPETVFGKLLERTVQSCKSGSRAIEVDPAILHFAIAYSGRRCDGLLLPTTLWRSAISGRCFQVWTKWR